MEEILIQKEERSLSLTARAFFFMCRCKKDGKRVQTLLELFQSSELNNRHNPHHRVILRMIKMVVENAHKYMGRVFVKLLIIEGFGTLYVWKLLSVLCAVCEFLSVGVVTVHSVTSNSEFFVNICLDRFIVYNVMTLLHNKCEKED